MSGFTTHLRPGARVRYLPAADAAVIEEHPECFLIDSRGILCTVCGAARMTPSEAVAHRETCTT